MINEKERECQNECTRYRFFKNILLRKYIREYIKNDVYQNIISHNSADSPLWILTRTTHKAKLWAQLN